MLFLAATTTASAHLRMRSIPISDVQFPVPPDAARAKEKRKKTKRLQSSRLHECSVGRETVKKEVVFVLRATSRIARRMPLSRGEMDALTKHRGVLPQQIPKYYDYD